MRLNKKYEVTQLKDLVDAGYVVTRNKNNDTYGVNSSGYIERRGIQINGKDYQIIYTSKGYGTITDDLMQYNQRFASKHKQYIDRVETHFKENVEPYLEAK